MDHEDDVCVGVYRTRDSVANLSLRVRVRRAAASLASSLTDDAAAADGSTQGHGGSTESVRSGRDGIEEEEEQQGQCIDEVVVGWQQKVFSQKELKYV